VQCALNKFFQTFKPHIFCAKAHFTIFLGLADIPGTTQPPSTGRLLLLHVSLPRELAMVGWFVPPSEPACFFIWGFSGRHGKYLWVFPPLCLRQPERNTAYQGFIYREMPVFCRRMAGLRMGGGQAVYGPSNHFRHRSGHNSFHSYTAACSKETTHPHWLVILLKGQYSWRRRKNAAAVEKYQCKKVFVPLCSSWNFDI